MKKAQEISKKIGGVLLLVTVLYGLFVKFTNAEMFALYMEYFFKAIFPLNVMFWLAVVALVFGNIASIKESLRKMVVSLKRQPSMIPMLILVVAFIYYSMNLTKLSNTTALVYGAGMGLCQFVIMLFSVLALVCMMNAFPKRKKANVPMVVLLFGMLAVNVYCALHYRDRVFYAVTREVSPIDTTRNPFIVEAYDMLLVYIVLICITAAFVALMPLYSKLLKKINTSVDIEYSGDMEQIEIDE